MTAVTAVRGAGGKGGGAGGGISESPDTLSSVALARFVELIAEGPIVGLVNGEYSVYIDGVALKNLEGTPNYRPYRLQSTVGTQSQLPIPGFTGTQQESAVGVKLTQAAGKLVRVIPDADADAVRVTVSVSGLSKTTPDGKVGPTKVEYQIWCRVQGGSWSLALQAAIDGKTNSRYQQSKEVPLAQLGTGPYEVAVQRITDDSASALLVDSIYWDSYTVINYEQFAYPNSALVALELDARYFSQIPERKYHVKGLLVRVPTNYDPITRQYATTGPGTTSGGWDGTFKIAYTNNPAWCYYDIVTNTRYGLGKRISAAQVSKWQMYEIAKYCDELVPTGNNSNVFEAVSGAGFSTSGRLSSGVPRVGQNLEPRFTLNCVINTLDSAYKVLNNLASVFRGMAYWASNSVMLTQDRPTPVSMIYNNANVVGGLFRYEGSARTDRHTVVTVGWNDPDEDFKQKFEYIEDREGIARYGIRQADIVAFGCTSRSQARRVGLWLLYTERQEKDAVTFDVGLDSSMVQPGAVVEIMDTHRTGARWGGRILGATALTVTLDAAIELEVDYYTLSVMARDGTVTTSAVNIFEAGTYDTLTVATAFTEIPAVMALWTLASSKVTPMQARVISVKQRGAVGYSLTCLEHNPTKYAAIEIGAPLIAQNYSILSFDNVPKVTGLVAVENSYKTTTNSVVQSNIDVSWDAIDDPLIRGYLAKVVSPTSVLNTDELKDPYLTLTGADLGEHTISVKAINRLGIPGPWETTTVTITGVDNLAPPDVTVFEYSLDVANGLRLMWVDVKDYIDYYEIREGASWESSTLIDQVKATSKTLGAVTTGDHKYLIKAIDTSGNESKNAKSVTVSIPKAQSPNLSYTIAGPDEVLTWTIPWSPFPIDRYEIREGATLESSIFVDSPKSTGYRRKVAFGGAKTYWIAAVDSMDSVGDYGQISVFIESPGPVTSPRSEVVDNNALLYWKPPTSGTLPVERYEVRKGTSYEEGVIVGSNGNSTFTAIFEQQAGIYSYWVVGADSAGNLGPSVRILATINQPPDYVLRTNVDSTFSGTKTNFFVENGKLIGPVDTTQTWATHFSSRGWASPQAQVTAGYPVYIQPSVASGAYSETLDYFSGAPETATNKLPATIVTATLGTTAISGSVSISCQIAYKLASADPWINAETGVTSVLIADFRYVRVTWTFTCTPGVNLIRVDSYNLKLSNKLRTDSGSGYANAADSGGTLVNFGMEFISADTPMVQPNGTTAIIGIVDYLAEPNPKSFKVLLFDRATGNRVSGAFSWTVRGY